MNTRIQTYRSARSKGFTLMEMILVLAIIAILVGGGVALMVGVLDDAGEGKAKADVQALETSLIRFRTLTGSMPSSLEDLIRRPSNGKGNWRQLVKESAIIDPWKQPYQYRNPGKRNSNGYDLYSKGVDMQDGTADDIGNWDK